MDLNPLIQPSLRHLLASEALSEAKVLTGEELLDREIAQVVTSLNPAPRDKSLLVARAGSLSKEDLSAFDSLAGVIIIKPFVVSSDLAAASGMGEGRAAAGSIAAGLDAEVKKLVKAAEEVEIPLVLVPGFGDAAQIAEDIRQAFLSEIKRSSSRLHAHLLSLVLEKGLSGLVDEMAERLSRPLVIETADFRVLAAQNMGPTPANQQRALTDQVSQLLAKQLADEESKDDPVIFRQPVRVGRRVAIPILNKGFVVGYLSAMLRPNDDVEAIFEFLSPVALAAMVDFSHRSKEVSAFAVTYQNLLKDLLSGRTLSSTDLDRLERHYGFDICDGLLVLAVQVLTGLLLEDKLEALVGQRYVTVDVEGTRAFVIPVSKKSNKTWQQEAEALKQYLLKDNSELTLQFGAGRVVENALELSDAYREARQALIIGSMMKGDSEFLIGYGDLGVRRLLYLMIDHSELDRFCEEILLPLQEYDSEWETELVPTISVYLKHGANLNSAARALFIHRHTLRYRLEQIAEILKVDIDSQDVLLNLQIALLIKDMKGISQS